VEAQTKFFYLMFKFFNLEKITVALATMCGVILMIALIFTSCKKEDDADRGPSKAFRKITWNSADKNVAAEIGFLPSDRTNASGPKITSNAHCADFPGIYFIWDSKQKDNGYLKVAAEVFSLYQSFTLTSKESNKYFDFLIAVQPGQEKTTDDCYVFYIPKVYNNKNINMVFVSERVEAVDAPIVVHLGFIGYYLHSGQVMSTSIHWQNLEEGDCIDWDAVDVAYAEWVDQGGLEPDRTLWQTSGYASYTFGDYEQKCFGDFATGQIEGYYLSYYVDPGYVKNIEFTVTVYHRAIHDGHFLYTNGEGETFSNTDEAYIEWLNNVDGFTFLNLYLACERINDPASCSSVEGYICSYVAKNNPGDVSFHLAQEGIGGNYIEALVTPVANGHYELTFWYDIDFQQ
jgi:hypothetical protein